MASKGSHTLLVILDGFGWSSNSTKNAVRDARRPNLENAFTRFPFCTIDPGGPAVGLPKGVVGNSEVGHLNLGAGKPVRQDLVRINESIDQKTFGERAEFKNLINEVRNGTKRLHLMGLISDGGVHSHLNHLKEIVRLLSLEKDLTIFLHGFMDGRDTPKNSGPNYLAEINSWNLPITWGSMQGRSWGMDRDRRWEKIHAGYNAIVGAGNVTSLNPEEYLAEEYSKNIYDEFISPICFSQQAALAQGDAVFFFNYRPDRAIQMTLAMKADEFKEFSTPIRPGPFLCMTPYCPEDVELPILFDKERIQGTLCEYLSLIGKKQFKIAETEKFAHITYFFNGGKKEPFPGEDRVLIPSPKEVATYDLKPQMSALEVTDKLVSILQADDYDFYLVNFANADMVGHTGNYEAAVKAVETLDLCMGRVIDICLKKDISLIVTADHGNADQMVYPDGSAHTSHSDAPAPFCFIKKEFENNKKISFINNPALKDIAPTILWSMGITQAPGFQGYPILKENHHG